MNRFALLLIATVLGIGACKQNPLPEDGTMVQTKPEEKMRYLPPLVLDVPAALEIAEGTKQEIPIKVSVPPPGKPILTINGLPDGAIWNPTKMTITWTPGWDAANDPKDANVISRTYPIHFLLSSSEDPVTVAQRDMIIIVRDVPRTMALSLPTLPGNLKEGQAFRQEIDVKSEDYPKGPFTIQIQNLPVGALVTRDPKIETKFIIKYTPSYRDVNLMELPSHLTYLDRVLDVAVFGPRGTMLTGKLTWRIQDVRAHAVIIAPSKVTQGTSATFTVTSEDPNGEVIPNLFIYPRPKVGVAQLKIDSSTKGDPAMGVNPSVVATLRWADIPPEKLGKTEKINIRSCVKQNRASQGLCTDKTIEVTFQSEIRKSPIVDRSAFPIGSERFVREQETFSVPVRVRDGEIRSTTIPSVKILPAAYQNEISWERNVLTIKAKSAGRKVFNLVATSVYGAVQVESFYVEVLPWSWSPMVLFGEGPSSAEVKNTSAFFDSVQVVNPSLQINDSKLMVLRKAVYLSTGAFWDPSIIPTMEKLVSPTRDLVVSTPLVEKLEGALKTELESLGVRTATRVADLSGYTMEIAPGSGLQTPSNPIRLAGKLTTESARPTPLNYRGGGFRPACKPLLLLKKAGEADLTMALLCNRRTGGGKFLVAGFEFGDIQTTPVDNRLIKKWLSDLVAK